MCEICPYSRKVPGSGLYATSHTEKYAYECAVQLSAVCLHWHSPRSFISSSLSFSIGYSSFLPSLHEPDSPFLSTYPWFVPSFVPSLLVHLTNCHFLWSFSERSVTENCNWIVTSTVFRISIFSSYAPPSVRPQTLSGIPVTAGLRGTLSPVALPLAPSLALNQDGETPHTTWLKFKFGNRVTSRRSDQQNTW